MNVQANANASVHLELSVRTKIALKGTAPLLAIGDTKVHVRFASQTEKFFGIVRADGMTDSVTIVDVLDHVKIAHKYTGACPVLGMRSHLSCCLRMTGVASIEMVLSARHYAPQTCCFNASSKDQSRVGLTLQTV